MIPIIVIGESHATFNFKGITEVVIKSIGSVTMHRVGRDKMDFKAFTKPPCVAIFCFGEIDIRMHVYKQVAQEGRDVDEVISKLVNDYVEVIGKQKDHNIIPVIMSITPPNRTEPNPMAVGDNKDRSIYCAKMNKLLKEACDLNKIEFLDVYDYYKDQDGLLKLELSDGNYHIGNNERVKEEFGILYRKLQGL